MKVYEVARIIGWSSRELLEWLRVQGHEVGSHASKLDDEITDDLIRHLMPEREEEEATPEEKEAVVPEVLRLDGDSTTAPSPISECGFEIVDCDANPETYRLIRKATVRVESIRLDRDAVISEETYLSLPDRVKAFFSS